MRLARPAALPLARGGALALALALGLAPALARAQDGVEVVQGGEPGIRILLAGTDIQEAATPGGAIGVDPAQSVAIAIRIAPPPNVTWEIRETRVAVLLRGPGSTPPDALVRASPTDASVPPGFTVFVNRSYDLAALKPLGAGLFLMRVEVADAQDATLYTQEFYVHVLGNVLFTVAGATASVATVATGYGLWQIVKDLKEAYQARQRHRRKKAQSRAGRLAAMGVSAGEGLEGLVEIAGDLDRDAERLSRRRPLAWTATGLGLGGVGISWLQFLGYVPVDVGNILVWGATSAALFLTASLVAIALQRRLRRRVEALRTRRVVVADAHADASLASQDVPEAPR